MINLGFKFIKIPWLLFSPTMALEMLIGISYAQVEYSASAQNIPLQHFTREYFRVSLFILSQGKAVARNDNKQEILMFTTN
jgi:hypothetical protein